MTRKQLKELKRTAKALGDVYLRHGPSFRTEKAAEIVKMVRENRKAHPELSR